MAYEVTGFNISLRAPSTAFSTYQFRAVKASSSGGYFKAASSGCNKIAGILQDAPTVAGESCNIMVNGVSKFKAHTAVSANDLLVSSTGGMLSSSTKFSGNYTQAQIIGICIGAASSSGIGTMLLSPVGITT